MNFANVTTLDLTGGTGEAENANTGLLTSPYGTDTPSIIQNIIASNCTGCIFQFGQVTISYMNVSGSQAISVVFDAVRFFPSVLAPTNFILDWTDCIMITLRYIFAAPYEAVLNVSKSIQYLQISSTGNMPPLHDIGVSSDLLSLSIQSPTLTGSIPAFGPHLSDIAIINTPLTGILPTLLPSLNLLTVTYTNLSGRLPTLPDSLGYSFSMIDLRYNYFDLCTGAPPRGRPSLWPSPPATSSSIRNSST